MFSTEFWAQMRHVVKEVVTELLQPNSGIKNPDEEFLTLNEAASLAKCHKNTIRNRIQSGKLEQFKSGKLVLVKKADVLKMLGNV